MKTTSTHSGWAIEKDFDWGKSFLGVCYFRDWCPTASLDLMGNKTMVFRTRRQARRSKALYCPGKGSRVLGVSIKINV